MSTRRRRGGSAQETQQVHTLGEDLVNRLAMLLKTARLHSVNNKALTYSIKIFVEAANTLLQHLGEWSLRGDQNSVFVNDVRIRPRPIIYENVLALLNEFRKRGVGGLRVNSGVAPTTCACCCGCCSITPSSTNAAGSRR